MSDTWISKAGIKKGALRKQLGYSQSEKIPKGLMKDIYKAPVGNKVRGRTVTPLLKKRVVFAVNAQKRRR